MGRELRHRRESLAQADAVVVVSRFVQATLPVESSTVIPNVIDFGTIQESLAGPVPALPERFVLFVGKLEANKAPDRAIAAVGKARLDIPLLIAGTGRLEDSLREQAKRLNVDARFLGWISEDMVRILTQRAAALVFPSRWEEPLSRVLLEGLAAGAILIVEPTGGTEEIVADGESGLVTRTEEDMAAALRMVLEEKSLASRLRRGAVERARETFSIDVVLPRLEALYEKVVAGR